MRKTIALGLILASAAYLLTVLLFLDHKVATKSNLQHYAGQGGYPPHEKPVKTKVVCTQIPYVGTRREHVVED